MSHVQARKPNLRASEALKCHHPWQMDTVWRGGWCGCGFGLPGWTLPLPETKRGKPGAQPEQVAEDPEWGSVQGRRGPDRARLSLPA